MPPEWVEWNAAVHMQGFDDLPKALRDRINYAESPQEGARPALDLAREIKARAKSEVQTKALDANGVKMIWS